MLPEPLPALLDPQYASLAREIAQAIRPVPDVLADYGFSGSGDPTWVELCQNPEFKRLLDEAQREWNAADTTKRRVQLKALISTEMSLPAIHGIIHDEKADRADRINAMKVMKSLAGLDAPPNPNGTGEGGSGIVVKINIGTQQVVKTAATQPVNIIEHESADA